VLNSTYGGEGTVAGEGRRYYIGKVRGGGLRVS